jgi:AraC-like DNA-binding protein
MYLIGYYGLHQPETHFIHSNQFEDNSTAAINEDKKKKYASSSLTEVELNRILNQLKQQMLEQKYFLKSDLKLADLSGYSGIPMHHISQVINEKLNKNFFDFINEYRIEEFKNRLTDSKFDNYTILAIGLDSGFNSKAAFNAAFKKITGITPSDFKKNHLLQKKTA